MLAAARHRRCRAAPPREPPRRLGGRHAAGCAAPRREGGKGRRGPRGASAAGGCARAPGAAAAVLAAGSVAAVLRVSAVLIHRPMISTNPENPPHKTSQSSRATPQNPQTQNHPRKLPPPTHPTHPTNQPPETTPAAAGGRLVFEGAPWNGSTLALIAAARAHCDLQLALNFYGALEVGGRLLFGLGGLAGPSACRGAASPAAPIFLQLLLNGPASIFLQLLQLNGPASILLNLSATESKPQPITADRTPLNPPLKRAPPALPLPPPSGGRPSARWPRTACPRCRGWRRCLGWAGWSPGWGTSWRTGTWTVGGGWSGCGAVRAVTGG